MKPVIVIGGGGHAKVLIDALQCCSAEILGYADPQGTEGQSILGVTWLGGDEAVLQHSPHEVLLVNGLGSVGKTTVRTRVFEQFQAQGYSFSSVIHPTATIASDVQLGEGVQVMAGAVIQTGCQIGANTIINTRTAVDHDGQIGSHVHIAPGSTLSGGVFVGAGTHIGTGSSVIQGVRIGCQSVIGAGSVVLKHVPDLVMVYGVPAKERSI